MEEHEMQVRGVKLWGRRRFLRQVVTSAGGGVVALLAFGEATSREPQPAKAGSGDKPAPRGYRLTDHIRTYYATLGS